MVTTTNNQTAEQSPVSTTATTMENVFEAEHAFATEAGKVLVAKFKCVLERPMNVLDVERVLMANVLVMKDTPELTAVRMLAQTTALIPESVFMEPAFVTLDDSVRTVRISTARMTAMPTHFQTKDSATSPPEFVPAMLDSSDPTADKLTARTTAPTKDSATKRLESALVFPSSLVTTALCQTNVTDIVLEMETVSMEPASVFQNIVVTIARSMLAQACATITETASSPPNTKWRTADVTKDGLERAVKPQPVETNAQFHLKTVAQITQSFSLNQSKSGKQSAAMIMDIASKEFAIATNFGLEDLASSRFVRRTRKDANAEDQSEADA